MAQTPQPGLLSSWVASFAAFDAAHGWAVNLFVVIALAAIGLAFLVGRPRIVFFAVVAGARARASRTGCLSRISVSSAASAPTRTA